MTFRTLPVLAIVFVADVAAAQTVTTTGSCPGVIDIDIRNFSPNGQFALLTGQGGGNDQIPAGPCAGTRTGLNNLTLRVLGNLNNGGNASLSPNVPNAACSQQVQVLDVNTCQLSAVTPLGSQCQNLNVAVPNVGPVGQIPDPAFFGISTSGIVANARAEDVTFNNAVLGQIPSSAQLIFTFLDAAFATECTISYDLSSAVPDNGFSTDSGAPFVDAMTVSLSGGESTCGRVNAATFGSTDLRDFLAQVDWSVAYGPMQALFAQELENAVFASGGDFANDFEPFTYSMYGTETGIPAFELSFAFSFERVCDQVEIDNTGLLFDPLDAPTGPLDAFVSAQSFFVFQL